MMKQKWTKKGTKVFSGILAAAMVMGAMTACGSSEEPVETTSTVQESTVAESEPSTEASTEEVAEEVTYYGEITAVDGSSITLALAEEGEAVANASEAVESTDAAATEEGTEAAETDAAEADTAEASTAGTETADAAAAETGTGSTEADGATMTIVADENTVVTVNGTEATVDELKAGDMVTVVMQGETVVSVTVDAAEAEADVTTAEGETEAAAEAGTEAADSTETAETTETTAE